MPDCSPRPALPAGLLLHQTERLAATLVEPQALAGAIAGLACAHKGPE